MSTTKISFWRIFWPSVVASISLSILGWIFWIFVLGALTPTPTVKDMHVLHMSLHGPIGERSETSINPTSFKQDEKIGLSDILFGLKQAKDDNSVDGIYLEIGAIQCGYATAMEIRNALIDFKKSGKFLIAYLQGEVVTQKQYYISTAAEKIYGFETSSMEFLGLGGELMFFKNTLDELGIEMQVIRGSNNDFKSAVEPYFRTTMSDSSRVQMQRYITSMWEDILAQISEARSIPVKTLNNLAENSSIVRLKDAYKYKLIDGLKYKDEVEKLVLAKTSKKDFKNMMTFEEYAHTNFLNNQLAFSDRYTPNIAVIVGEGGITVDGDELTSQKICSYFKEVRNDNNIKAVVFRVNSPGGSALASEEIWREVSLTAKKKKVIVSMGDVAASGGYYISTPADVIFAEPTTITGSIGVFGVIPYLGNFMENKLGLTFDHVQTNKHSVLSLNRKLTEDELKLIQQEVDLTYMQFKKRVADGRKLSLEVVQKVARGRVWTGKDALKIGLVDKLGGFEEALAYTLKEVKISDARIKYYPEEKTSMLDDIIKQLSEEEQVKLKIKTSKVPRVVEELTNQLNRIESCSGIQMRLPFDVQIH